MGAPKIILVDDHALFRDGIKTLIELSGIGTIIGEANNGEEFLSLLENNTPDLVLMDIEMNGMNGLEATKKATLKYPEIKILVLSMFDNKQYYHQMIEEGALGFVLKTADKSELERAIKSVLGGHPYYSNNLLLEMIHHQNPTPQGKAQNEQLTFTDKEIEILELMCQGNSNEAIAESVFLSVKTVANYRNNMLQKTGCKNASHLIYHVLKTGILKL